MKRTINIKVEYNLDPLDEYITSKEECKRMTEDICMEELCMDEGFESLQVEVIDKE